MSRAAIHFGGLITKTPTTTNSAIVMSASKDFLTHHLFHNEEGEKEMLEVEMEEVIDRFQYLSNSNIRNVISLFCSINQGGVIDNIMIMKKEFKFKYIHYNVFLKEKLYVFKMLTEGHFQDACCIGVPLFKKTLRKTSRKHLNNNTVHYANNTNMQRLWRRLRHVTLPSSHGGYHLELPMKMRFITWNIGLHFGISGTSNGVDSCKW